MRYFQKRNKAKMHCHFVEGLYWLGNKVQSQTDPYDAVPCLFGPLPPPRLDLRRNLRALKPPLIPDMPIHTTPPPGPTLCPVNITQKMSKHCQTLKSTKSLPKNSLYSLFCGYLNQHGNICSTCRKFLVQRRRTSGNTSGQPHNHDFLFLRMSKHRHQEKVINDQIFTMIVFLGTEKESTAPRALL